MSLRSRLERRVDRLCSPVVKLTNEQEPIPFSADWAMRFIPHYFTSPLSKFHRELIDLLAAMNSQRGQRVNILAPRGAAKSTWSTLAYPLWCLCEGTESYIVLTSDTGPQAEKYLDSIRDEIADNEEIARHYPHVAGIGPVWRSDAITTRSGIRVEALGTGTKMRGRKYRQHRPTLIVVDDPQNTGHVISKLQRDRSWDWITKDVCNAGGPETNVVVLGTALQRECIVCRLEITPQWTSKRYASVMSWPSRTDLWDDWERILHDYDNPHRNATAREFYEAHRAEMDAGSEVLWPEREPIYDLMVLRATIGKASFACEKQNVPVNPEACEWPEEYFGDSIWFDEWPAKLEVKTLALDPSKGSDAKHGDYSAYVWVGVDSELRLWVDADLQRRDASTIIDDGIRRIRDFGPHEFVLETNQFQSLFRPLFRQRIEAEALEVTVRGIDNTTNKGMRIRRVGPYLSQRRIRFRRRSPGAAMLVQQLRDFPIGDHDDGPDSLDMAIQAAVSLWNKTR